ncbi:hypothetical protein ABIB38_001748 [Massilia sp. UYP11]|uniref:hypothetical protein n=1 Tax=Massilia sp. UYP11 TaxID=1756385 RepID=UPI003D1BC4C7
MNQHCCAATGKPTYDYKIQHPACEKHLERDIFIVAELSFSVHFVALPSLRFTYGNHTATLASITPPDFLRLYRPVDAAEPELQS